jgi:hypothetical protein
MTAATYPIRNRPGISLTWPVLLLLAIFVWGAWRMSRKEQEQEKAGSGVIIAAAKPIPTVVPDKHAETEHPVDAKLIRKCLNDKKGADEIWRHTSHEKFYLVCHLPDGRWGFQTIYRDAEGVWREITAFVKGDGSRQVMERYLGQFSSKFNGPYPWP